MKAFPSLAYHTEATVVVLNSVVICCVATTAYVSEMKRESRTEQKQEFTEMVFITSSGFASSG